MIDSLFFIEGDFNMKIMPLTTYSNQNQQKELNFNAKLKLFNERSYKFTKKFNR